nr:hypothetical protein [Tanacetum cinerariifolium]
IENQHDPSRVVKVTLCLGSEKHAIEYQDGIILDQLVFVKGDSMGILKEYITKHNVPNDVPDDAEILSEDDDVSNLGFTHSVLMVENAQRSVVTRTNFKPPTLAAYMGVVPLIAKICQPENWKKKNASLEEMWKREFFTGRKM